MALESKWLPSIRETTIYCYELPVKTFSLLDECAGYYISYDTVVPLSVRPVNKLLSELLHRRVDVGCAMHKAESGGEPDAMSRPGGMRWIFRIFDFCK